MTAFFLKNSYFIFTNRQDLTLHNPCKTFVIAGSFIVNIFLKKRSGLIETTATLIMLVSYSKRASLFPFIFSVKEECLTFNLPLQIGVLKS